MLGGLEKRVDETFPPIGFEQRSRQPGGLISVPDRARLAEVAGPENALRRRAGPIVRDDQTWSLLEKGGVPETTRRLADNPRGRYDRKVLRGSRHPIEERTPRRLRLLLSEPLQDHRNHDVAAPDADFFSPMWIEERLRVEFDGFGDEAAVGVVGCGLYGRKDSAKEIGQGMRAQGHAGDDAEPAAALQRPEEVGIRAGVGDFDIAVGG